MERDDLNRRLGEVAGQLAGLVPHLMRLEEQGVLLTERVTKLEALHTAAKEAGSKEADAFGRRLYDGEKLFKEIEQRAREHSTAVNDLKRQLKNMIELEEYRKQARERERKPEKPMHVKLFYHVLNHFATAIVGGIVILLSLGLKEWIKGVVK
jgi:vacuolar-type H+-ATPase subunit I/STV1